MNGSKSTFIPSNQFLVYHFQATENKRTKIDIFSSKIEITFDLWNSVFGFKWKFVSGVWFSLHFTNIFFQKITLIVMVMAVVIIAMIIIKT